MPGHTDGRPRHQPSKADLKFGWEERQRRNPRPLSYTQVHVCLERYRDKDSNCRDCGGTENLEWAYAGADHNAKQHGFSTNLDDYVTLCRTCHGLFDRKAR